MLGSITIYGGSKGMVGMPNLSGLSRSAAIAAIESAGLIFASSTSVSSTSANDGKVVSQSVSNGTLIDYESSVTLEVGLYTAPSGPVVELKTDTELDADGATVLKVYVVNDGLPTCEAKNVSPFNQVQKKKRVYRTYKYVDGVKDESSLIETPTGNPTAPSVITPNSTDCGYVAPPAVTCTTTAAVISEGTCSNGFKTDTLMNTTTCTDGSKSSGSPYNSTSACCVSLGTTYSNCGRCVCGYMTCDATTSTLCGTVTTTHPSTKATVSCPGGALGAC